MACCGAKRTGQDLSLAHSSSTPEHALYTKFFYPQAHGRTAIASKPIRKLRPMRVTNLSGNTHTYNEDRNQGSTPNRPKDPAGGPLLNSPDPRPWMKPLFS